MRALVSVVSAFLLFLPILADAKTRKGTVTFRIDMSGHKNADNIRLWVPYPLSNDHQRIDNMQISGEFNDSAIYREPVSGATYIYTEWDRKSKNKTMVMKFRVSADERTTKKLVDTGQPVPPEIKKYLRSSWFIPTYGEIKKLADEITAGKKGILEKSRAVYDWTVENTSRDPDVKGCGLGIVEQTLIKRSGKCADISSVYVALARAAGVPSREVFGLRLGKKDDQDMTKGHHCWAEFYLPGTGWVQVDPADVRKVMLVKNLDLKKAKPHREYFFGSVDQYRIALERGGRGLNLIPKQKAGPVNYLMYPYAEIDGKALDFFEPEEFRYTVHFKAD